MDKFNIESTENTEVVFGIDKNGQKQMVVKSRMRDSDLESKFTVSKLMILAPDLVHRIMTAPLPDAMKIIDSYI